MADNFTDGFNFIKGLFASSDLLSQFVEKVTDEVWELNPEGIVGICDALGAIVVASPEDAGAIAIALHILREYKSSVTTGPWYVVDDEDVVHGPYDTQSDAEYYAGMIDGIVRGPLK